MISSLRGSSCAARSYKSAKLHAVWIDLRERTMTVSEALQDPSPFTALLEQLGDNLSAASMATCRRI